MGTESQATQTIRPLSNVSYDYYVPEDPMDALQCDSCQ